MNQNPTTSEYRGDYIAGTFRAPAQPQTFEIRCPADTNQLLTAIHFDTSSPHHAIAAAREALPDWRRLPAATRAELLTKYKTLLKANRAAIARAIALEVGKPLWEADTEVGAMIAKVDLSLGAGADYTRHERVDALPGEVRHRPLGVLAVIGPFNFPGHLPNGHLVPALLMGNTVVFKPSESTPLTASWIAHCFHEAGFPPGVVNVVFGAAATGRALTTSEDVDGILFTGSAAVGTEIVKSNLNTLDRVVALELGGKNPAIALADCHVEDAAKMIAYSAFVTAGQRCTATSRLIVAEPIAPALCARLVELGRNIKIGHPLSPNTFMGPVISAASKARVLEATATAVSAGAEPLLPSVDGSIDHPQGHFLRPSIHRLHSPAAVPGYSDEELFGPDLSVVVVSDEAEAWAVANDTKFGLSASVFTQDAAAFERGADELRVGVLHWNRPSAGASGRLPFSGLRNSGNHRPAGILAGATSSYPLSVLLPKPGAGLGPWPGFDGHCVDP